MLAPGAIVGSRYRVIREIGRGGMGAVYLVEHLHTGLRHAMKVLHPHLVHRPHVVERFRREARAAGQIDSDHVARVTDADVDTALGVHFLVMELLNGLDLERLVRERGALLPIEVVTLLSQVARALDRAHAKGIVHRDLKPENIFFHHPPHGVPILKVVDFGIVKTVADSDDAVTTAGAVLGTPLYMAPEQAAGETVTPASDVFALGMIALRLLVGRPYFRATTRAEVIAELLSPMLAPPSMALGRPDLAGAFDGWFARTCHRDPQERLPSAGEAVAALADALGVARAALDASLAPAAWSATPTPSHGGGAHGALPSPYAPTTPGTSALAARPPPSPTRISGGMIALLLVGTLVVMLGAGAVAALAVGGKSDPKPRKPFMQVQHVLNGSALTNNAILRVVEDNRSELMSCYRAALKRDKTTAGPLTLMMTVDAKGAVMNVMPALGGIDDRSFRRCCEQAAGDWRFSEPGDEVAAFQVLLLFGLEDPPDEASR